MAASGQVSHATRHLLSPIQHGVHDRLLRNASLDDGQTYSRLDVIHHLTQDYVYSGGRAQEREAASTSLLSLYASPLIVMPETIERFTQ